MGSTLLSVVVPTKNRSEYLESLVKMVCSFHDERIELIIQDNSEDNSKIKDLLNKELHTNIKYFYDGSLMDLVANSELGISHANGKYVCFMGDDDLVSSRLADFVQLMDENDIESAIFSQNSFYYWPGLTHKIHKFPALSLEKYKGRIQRIDVKKEYINFLNKGATTMLRLPQLYHGVILRKRLEEIKAISGCYFPGPCPDMAVCVALAYVVKQHVYCDIPLIVSGAAPKSAAALGAKHEHKDKIENVKTLPPDTARRWEKTIPLIWTWVSIYGESAIKAMRNMKHEEDIQKFNFVFFYAYFFVFCNEFRHMIKPYVKKMKVRNRFRFGNFLTVAFLYRTAYFAYNVVRTKMPNHKLTWKDIKNTFEAEKMIDNRLKTIELGELFLKCGVSVRDE